MSIHQSRLRGALILPCMWHLMNIRHSMLCIVPRDVVITPDTQSVRPGQQLILECTAQGTQPITYEWSKADGTLSPWAIIDDGSLEIESIRANDAGQYQCRATNRAGYTDAYADVTVLGISNYYTIFFT